MKKKEKRGKESEDDMTREYSYVPFENRDADHTVRQERT